MTLSSTNETFRNYRAVVMAVAIGGLAIAGSTGAEADEFGYSGNNGPGFWAESSGG